MHNSFPGFPKIQKKISYIKLIKVLLSRWQWLCSILILGITMGYLYLLFTPPLYVATASLKFDEKKSELSELLNVRNIYDRTNKAESEKLVITSRSVLGKALNSLDCRTSFYTRKNFNLIDIYPQKPLSIKILKYEASENTFPVIEFKKLSNFKCHLVYEINNKKISRDYKYGDLIIIPGLIFKISAAKNNISTAKTYTIRFNTETDLIEKINRSLKLDDTQNVNILNFKFTDRNPFFAADLLNAILSQYLEFDKKQRSITASQTSDFIDKLLKTMSDTLDASGQALQRYKEHNKMLNVSSISEQLTNRLTNLETEKHALDMQNVLTKFLEKNVKTADKEEKLNTGLHDITDPQLSYLISKYNDLLLAKKAALYTYTPNSGVITQFDDNLTDLKNGIITSISSRVRSNSRAGNFINRQIDSVYKFQKSIPKAERVFITLQSKFEIDQKINSYLQEKKLETEISKAAVVSSAFIIDKAVYPLRPAQPIARDIYTTFILVSILLGTGLIFIIRAVNPYIYNKESLSELSSVPIIGVINRHKEPGSRKNHQIKIVKNPRSPFSESLKSVRSNLSFMGSEKDSKIICITSEVSGEGKSFLSLNLAYSLTLLNKTVLLIAADLRKSKLHEALNSGNQIGLSKYLAGQVRSEDIIFKTSEKDLDFIASGPAPPNSSELLHSKRMQDLLNDLKNKYDFILIDTAPIGLVTDSKPLIKIADINLFILRSGISKHEFAITPGNLQKEFGLTDVAIILNDFEDDKFHRSYNVGVNNLSEHKDYYHPNYTNYSKHKDYFEL